MDSLVFYFSGGSQSGMFVDVRDLSGVLEVRAKPLY